MGRRSEGVAGARPRSEGPGPAAGAVSRRHEGHPGPREADPAASDRHQLLLGGGAVPLRPHHRPPARGGPGPCQQDVAVSSQPMRTFLDPSVVARLGTLELKAKAIVEGFLSGLHRSPFKGFSVEFAEYRQYMPGDDLATIDWKVYARSDRHY